MLSSSVAFVDLTDVAILHVIALLDPEVQNERVHAWTERNNWSKIEEAFRGLYPETSWAHLPQGSQLEGTVNDKRGKELLKKWTGQDDWTSVRESVKTAIEGVKPAVLGLGYSW